MPACPTSVAARSAWNVEDTFVHHGRVAVAAPIGIFAFDVGNFNRDIDAAACLMRRRSRRGLPGKSVAR